MLERSGIGLLLRRVGAWRGALILNYHRIGVPDGRGFEPEIWSASAEAFDEQLRLLSEHFEIVTPADLLDHPDRHGRRILITFDDGYRDNYETALPLLQKWGARATFFVVPGLIDQPRVVWWDEIAWLVGHSEAERVELPEFGLAALDLSLPGGVQEASTTLAEVYKRMPGARSQDLLDRLAELTTGTRCPAEAGAQEWLTWDQVRALAGAGMTIGGHTLTHPVLARLAREQQEGEIFGCATRLSEELRAQMEFFSYPVGLSDSYDGHSRELVERAGVRAAFAFEGGYVDARRQLDPFAIPRAGVARGTSRDRFAAMITLPQLFSRW